MWTSTNFTRTTRISRGSDKESDTDSHTDQSTVASAECLTETSHAISWEEPLERGDHQAKGAWGIHLSQIHSSQSIHSPRLIDSQAMVLHPRQVDRLETVLNSLVLINGVQDVESPPLPTLACRPIDFLDVLLRNMAMSDIQVSDVRLYGGAASYVISDSSSSFNDIDIMIHVDFDAKTQHLYLNGIKSVVLMSLREVIKDVLTNWCTTQIPAASILDDKTLTKAYIAKMYRHIGSEHNLGNDENNIWSLFSFNNFEGRNIEIKFIHTLKRQYTFSIDSWQIDLSNFLRKLNNRCVAQRNGLRTICYCLFPDLKVAYEDVKRRLVRVVKPETVRGGCFLRYVDLLYKGYKLPSNRGIIEQELVMLERFLLDFPDQTKQSEALDGYLQSHMGSCTPGYKLLYVRLLESIMNRVKARLGADNLPPAASTLAAVIKAKVQNYFGRVCKANYVFPQSRLLLNHSPQSSFALNHTPQRRFCNIINVPTRPRGEPKE